ncbi:hypothetical protein F5B19DRAFT_487766 [Rostrohypoxylon terebratum]|nr:hypothetical protein F5B19DRAFT_487766 [Rostrohypoxylon terebratum]
MARLASYGNLSSVIRGALLKYDSFNALTEEYGARISGRPDCMLGCICPCKRSFESSRAKQQHLEDSPSHYVCTKCDYRPDLNSEAELKEHAETAYNCCTICDRVFDAPYQLQQHDMCKTCGTYCNSPSDLKNHLKTHTPKNVKYFGCVEMFVWDSAMMLHLETGNCESGTDEDYMTRMAFKCSESGKYICCDKPDFNFKCPTCDTPFSFISGVLQHIKSDYCDDDLTANSSLSKFLRFFKKQLS